MFTCSLEDRARNIQVTSSSLKFVGKDHARVAVTFKQLRSGRQSKRDHRRSCPKASPCGARVPAEQRNGHASWLGENNCSDPVPNLACVDFGPAKKFRKMISAGQPDHYKSSASDLAERTLGVLSTHIPLTLRVDVCVGSSLVLRGLPSGFTLALDDRPRSMLDGSSVQRSTTWRMSYFGSGPVPRYIFSAKRCTCAHSSPPRCSFSRAASCYSALMPPSVGYRLYTTQNPV